MTEDPGQDKPQQESLLELTEEDLVNLVKKIQAELLKRAMHSRRPAEKT